MVASGGILLMQSIEITDIFQSVMQGVEVRRLPSDFAHVRVHYLADPVKRGDWASRYSAKYGGMDDPRWQREMEISYSAYTGQRLWPLLCADHNAHFDVFDGNWAVYRSIDQGIRHPTACAWVAVNKYGDRHVFREFYSTDRSIAENCRLIRGIDRDETLAGSIIDPSTRKRSEESLTPLIDIYESNGVYAEPADNSFAGYDRVSQMLLSTLCRKKLAGEEIPQLDKFNLKKSMLKQFSEIPCLTFDLRYVNRVYMECSNLRWAESKGDLTQRRPKEKPVDVDDEGADIVRYACQTELSYVKPPKKNKDFDFDFDDYFRLKAQNARLKETVAKSRNRAYA